MISGNFDVASVTRNDYFKKVFYEYHLSIYEPEDRQITLLPRRKELPANKSVTFLERRFESGVKNDGRKAERSYEVSNISD